MINNPPPTRQREYIGFQEVWWCSSCVLPAESLAYGAWLVCVRSLCVDNVMLQPAPRAAPQVAPRTRKLFPLILMLPEFKPIGGDVDGVIDRKDEATFTPPLERFENDKALGAIRAAPKKQARSCETLSSGGDHTRTLVDIASSSAHHRARPLRTVASAAYTNAAVARISWPHSQDAAAARGALGRWNRHCHFY
jgi:hypothetical protein